MSDKNGVVLERLQDLIRNSGKTRQAIAEDLKCDTSTVTKQFNGDMKLSVDYLVRYAKYFNVSTDYLLGLAQEPTDDANLNAICEYTHLSAESIETLHSSSKHALNSSLSSFIQKDYIYKENAKLYSNEEYKGKCDTLTKEYLDYLLSKKGFEKLYKVFQINHSIISRAIIVKNIIEAIPENVFNITKENFLDYDFEFYNSLSDDINGLKKTLEEIYVSEYKLNKEFLDLFSDVGDFCFTSEFENLINQVIKKLDTIVVRYGDYMLEKERNDSTESKE